MFLDSPRPSDSSRLSVHASHENDCFLGIYVASSIIFAKQDRPCTTTIYSSHVLSRNNVFTTSIHVIVQTILYANSCFSQRRSSQLFATSNIQFNSRALRSAVDLLALLQRNTMLSGFASGNLQLFEHHISCLVHQGVNILLGLALG